MKIVLTAGTLLLPCIAILAGCSATPVKPGGSQQGEFREFPKSVDVVRQAAVDALAVKGFEITKSESFYVEGYRPRTWGFFCTPGGETSGIWLEQAGPSLTKAWISTAISSFGRLCQKDWTAAIVTEMENTLNSQK